MQDNPKNPKTGATWLSRTGATWLKPVATAGLALALIGAVTVKAPAEDTYPASIATVAPTPGAFDQPISFSSNFAAVDAASSVSLTAAVTPPNIRSSSLRSAHNNGHTGQGIDIAIIDTGVSPVQGLDAPGKVFHGPDLSAEGAVQNLATLDSFGHGTHLAGIMAGNDGTANGYKGFAPDSRVVSLKIAGADGATTVAQAVAAIDWVVEHRTSNGLNIRVLNLSFGVSGLPNHLNDPLSAAAERAWDAGIVVVAAAGNQGNNSNGLDSPAISPYVIAVAGGNNHLNTGGIASWSSGGNGDRDPDVTIFGKSVHSLRVAGSTLDNRHPKARYGTRFMRGSGTSQAAAAMSGLAAVLLSKDGTMTPDEVKSVLMDTANEIDRYSTVLDGEGAVRANKAVRQAHWRRHRAEDQAHPTALGITSWAGVDTWSGGHWNGATWSGATWSGATWSGATWSGATWSGATWSGATWSGATWSGATWSGATWSGASYDDEGWTLVGQATTELPPGARAVAFGAQDDRIDPADAPKPIDPEDSGFQLIIE